MTKLRLAIVVSHPIQHFCPLYRALTETGRIDVRVFFGSDAGAVPYFDSAFDRKVDWGADITIGFNHEYLRSTGGSVRHDVGRTGNRHLFDRLTAYDPDVVQVYGYSQMISLQAMIWARLHRRSSVMIGDSELLSPRPLHVRAMKRVTLPLVYRVPTGFLSIGDENESYLAHYGVGRSRMHRSPIPIDTPLLGSALQSRQMLRPETRKAWGASEGDVVLLAVGKSIARKGHDHLIQAATFLPDRVRRRALIVLAGGGPDTEHLVELANHQHIRLHCAGFLPVDQLAAAYVSADILVHPSMSDPHPLAVAEGIFCGLPVVVSDRVGSWGPSDDVNGNNGRRYRFGDHRALAAALTELVENTSLRAALGRASRAAGEQRTLSDSADSYVRAVYDVHARRRAVRRAGNGPG